MERKTTDVIRIYANYGYGWEEIDTIYPENGGDTITRSDRKEAQRLLQEYKISCPNASYQMKNGREKK